MLPGRELSWGVSYELQSAERGSETVRLPTVFVDADFIEMLDIKLVAGGNFTRDIGGEQESQFILNESESGSATAWGHPDVFLERFLCWPSS